MTASSQFGRSRFQKLVALAGILLFAVFSFVQAVHLHPDLGGTDSPHCAICAVAHSPATLTAPVILPALAFTHIPLVYAELHCYCSAVITGLYSRPPPPAVLS